jgi:hypothetical protein
MASVGPELEHFDRIPQIEVKYLVRCQAVHLGKSAAFEQVIDSCGCWARAAIGDQRVRRSIRAAKEAAFDGVRLEREEFF